MMMVASDLSFIFRDKPGDKAHAQPEILKWSLTCLPLTLEADDNAINQQAA